MKRRVGITLGDPSGIGPEIVVRALAKLENPETELTLYGSQHLIHQTCENLGLGQSWKKQIRFVPAGPDPKNGFSFDNKRQRAESTLAMLDKAIEAAQAGEIDAIVTAPIDKAVVRTLIPDFTGHTEYLAQKAGVERTIMLLDNTEIRVVLVTQHIALRDVSKMLTREELLITLQVAVKAFREWFNIPHPHIAVAGLNPHAGEIVENPEEEIVMRPLIVQLQKEGWNIEGPFAADSLFPLARNGKYDFLVSPYHDQGLVAAKYPGLDKVVNITLGLPFLRISPAHGTAYDLVGKKKADTRSFERALQIAMKGKL